MMIHIAICDDSEPDSTYLTGLVHKWATENNLAIHIDTFPSAEAFLFAYAERKDFDLLLLDIEMGEMDGVSLAKQLRLTNRAIQIAFITGYTDYIAEGYEVSALHYLVKPVKEDKLFSVLDRSKEQLARNEAALFLQINKEMVRIPLYEIRCLEVCQNYVTIHAACDYTIKRTLGDLEKELTEEFFRIGRSFIVNLSYIRRVTRTEVELNDGFRIPLPRGMYESLNRAIITHL